MSSNPQIVETETLARLAGYKVNQHKWIEKWCKNNGIHYFPSRKGPTTTVDLLNAAKGLTALPKKKPDSII